MREWIEVSAKTVDEAKQEAAIQLGTASDNIDFEVVDEGATGFLGINKKPAIVKASIKVSEETSTQETVLEFLKSVLTQMGLSSELSASYNEEEKTLNVNILGEEMGILIGKRGQTLDSLQYLASLVLNKNSEEYIKVKLDTENYRERRKETLENLAKNISFKVKKTRRSVALEPMNPYERRIIHSALQNDKFVETHSEGEEPFRKVIISLKKGVYQSNNRYGYQNKGGNFHRGGSSYGNRSGYNKGGFRKPYKKNYNSNYSRPSTVANSVEKTDN